MFSSGGYFRSVNCPFFVHGLCHRPYCHFRHAKPGHGSTSKNTTTKSCLKPKTVATTSKPETEGPSLSKPLQTSTNEESLLTKSSLDSKADLQEQNNITKDTTNLLANLKDLEAEQQPKEERKEKDLPLTSKKTASILDSLNKLEQAVDEASASLLFHSNTKNLSFTANSNSKDSKTHTTLCTNSSSNSTTKNGQKTIEDSKKQEQNVSMDVQSSDIKCQDIDTLIQNNDQTKYNEIETSHKEISTDKELLHIDQKVEVFSETLAYDVSGDLSRSGVTSILKETPIPRTTKDQNKESLVLTKKRKSSEILDVDIKKAKLKKNNSDEDSVKLESKELTLIPKDIALENLEKSKIPNDKKNKNNDCDKQNSDLKRQPKPKAELKTVDIDFFTSPKKVKKNKMESKEKRKNKKEEKEVQNNDINLLKMSPKKIQKKSDNKSHTQQKLRQNERKEKKNSIKSKVQKNEKMISSVPLTTSLFESEDEVRFSSDSLSGSDSEPEAVDSSTEMLREIFDNYDPQNDLPITSSSTKKAKVTSTPTSSQSSTNVSPAKDKVKAADLQGLSKKPRVAHGASYLIQRKSSNLNPVRRVPKTLASNSSAPSTQRQSNEYNLVDSKKRVAHQPKPTSESSLPRPRIPIEYGAKVPQGFRQRYLDKLIDENLRLCASEQEAFEKAVEEERSLYNRSTRRHLYLNLCINAIKNLRSQPTPDHQSKSTYPQVNTTTGTTSKHGISHGIPHGISATPTVTKSSKKIDTNNLTEEMFYDLLCQYILTEEQLVGNGFPRNSPTTPGKVTFKLRKPPTTTSKDPNRRTCCRCGRLYTVREDGTYVTQEECVYHVGRLLKRRTAGEVTTTYSCCGSDGSTPGCSVCKFHVSEGKDSTDGFMTTIVSPLAGNQKKVFAVDCEMCYTVAGLELTRATVVDWKLEKVYDTFVKPDNAVLDYNTRFSGVTEECLRGVRTSIREVQAVLLSIIHRDSILVGHSLESDLLALKLVHSTVVDTSVVFPHRLGPPYKRALRTLTAEYLKRIIQDDEAGHDSQEDAKASLELMLYKAKEDWKKKERNKR